MQVYCRHGNAEFCRLMGNFGEKPKQFFFRKCSMMLIEP